MKNFSFTCYFSLETWKTNTDSLKNAEWSCYGQIENVFTIFTENNETFVFTLRVLSIFHDDKVFNTWQFSLSFHIQNIRLNLFVPFCLFVNVLINTMTTFLVIQRLQWFSFMIFYLWVLGNVYTHFSRSIKSEKISLIRDCSSGLIFLRGFWMTEFMLNIFEIELCT